MKHLSYFICNSDRKYFDELSAYVANPKNTSGLKRTDLEVDFENAKIKNTNEINEIIKDFDIIRTVFGGHDSPIEMFIPNLIECIKDMKSKYTDGICYGSMFVFHDKETNNAATWIPIYGK